MNKAKIEKLQSVMKSLRFGIEIETVGLHPEQLAVAIQPVVGGTVSYSTVTAPDGRQWKVVTDGSLSSYTSGEITSPILTYADLEPLQAIVRAVRAAGARVDSSCGIHIHVDGSTFTAKSVKALVRLIYSREPAIENALRIKGSLRRQRYCRPVARTLAEGIRSARGMNGIKRLWYGYSVGTPSRYDSTRYHGVNLNSFFYRGTVEFRWFNGSLHAGEVKAYVQLVLAFAARSLTSGSVGKRRESGDRRDVLWTLTNQLGLVGDEFKNTREHLTKHLPVRAAQSAVAAPVQATEAARRALGQDEADAAAQLRVQQEQERLARGTCQCGMCCQARVAFNARPQAVANA